MADCGDSSLRIVLIGNTGAGKSATANTILGEKIFRSQVAAQAVTKTCQKASREWKGRKLLVVDTQGLFDTKESLKTSWAEISRCVLYSCPGPHAIVVVLTLGRFTEEEWKTITMIKEFFGEAAVKHMVVLFTRKDHLENVNLNDFVAEEGDKLKTFIKECGNRYLAFNNRANKAEKEAQVQELVELIDTMVQDNGGSYFSNATYEDCEERLKKRIDDLRKFYTNKRKEECRQVEEEYAQKQDKLRQEKEEKLKSNEREYEEKMRNIRKEAENNVFAQILVTITNILSKVRHFFQI